MTLPESTLLTDESSNSYHFLKTGLLQKAV